MFTEGTCKLLNLVISDLVDEDYVIHNRHQAVSALMFGTSALLSKPGQTLAPLIGTWLLAQQTGMTQPGPSFTKRFCHMKFVNPRLTIKRFLFALTRPTQKNYPYPKNFTGLPENDFLLFHVLRFSFSISSVLPFKNAEMGCSK